MATDIVPPWAARIVGRTEQFPERAQALLAFERLFVGALTARSGADPRMREAFWNVVRLQLEYVRAFERDFRARGTTDDIVMFVYDDAAPRLNMLKEMQQDLRIFMRNGAPSETIDNLRREIANAITALQPYFVREGHRTVQADRGKFVRMVARHAAVAGSSDESAHAVKRLAELIEREIATGAADFAKVQAAGSPANVMRAKLKMEVAAQIRSETSAWAATIDDLSARARALNAEVEGARKHVHDAVEALVRAPRSRVATALARGVRAMHAFYDAYKKRARALADPAVAAVRLTDSVLTSLAWVDLMVSHAHATYGRSRHAQQRMHELRQAFGAEIGFSEAELRQTPVFARLTSALESASAAFMQLLRAPADDAGEAERRAAALVEAERAAVAAIAGEFDPDNGTPSVGLMRQLHLVLRGNREVDLRAFARENQAAIVAARHAAVAIRKVARAADVLALYDEAPTWPLLAHDEAARVGNDDYDGASTSSDSESDSESDSSDEEEEAGAGASRALDVASLRAAGSVKPQRDAVELVREGVAPPESRLARNVAEEDAKRARAEARRARREAQLAKQCAREAEKARVREEKRRAREAVRDAERREREAEKARVKEEKARARKEAQLARWRAKQQAKALARAEKERAKEEAREAKRRAKEAEKEAKAREKEEARLARELAKEQDRLLAEHKARARKEAAERVDSYAARVREADKQRAQAERERANEAKRAAREEAKRVASECLQEATGAPAASARSAVSALDPESAALLVELRAKLTRIAAAITKLEKVADGCDDELTPKQQARVLGAAALVPERLKEARALYDRLSAATDGLPQRDRVLKQVMGRMEALVDRYRAAAVRVA